MVEPADGTRSVSLFEEIFPGDTNAYGTAFGGKILALMDRAAGLAASRFAHCHFVTAALDSLALTAPVKQGEIAEVHAKVVFASSHTAGIRVRVFAMDKCAWRRRPCCEGMFFMVAVGPEGEVMRVPDLHPADEEERRELEEARTVHRALLAKRRSPGE